jgi:hypothetical protein
MLDFWTTLRLFGTLADDGCPTVLEELFGLTLGFALLLRAWRELLVSVSPSTMRVGLFKGLIILTCGTAEEI